MSESSTIENLGNGRKLQRNADGTTIESFPDGLIIQITPDGTKLEIFPDNNRKQTNPDGTVIEIRADGSMMQTNPDGSSVEVRTDGTRFQKNADGVSIEIFPDGRRIQSHPDGTVLEISAKGEVSRQKATHSAATPVVSATTSAATPAPASNAAAPPVNATPAPKNEPAKQNAIPPSSPIALPKKNEPSMTQPTPAPTVSTPAPPVSHSEPVSVPSRPVPQAASVPSAQAPSRPSPELSSSPVTSDSSRSVGEAFALKQAERLFARKGSSSYGHGSSKTLDTQATHSVAQSEPAKVKETTPEPVAVKSTNPFDAPPSRAAPAPVVAPPAPLPLPTPISEPEPEPKSATQPIASPITIPTISGSANDSKAVQDLTVKLEKSEAENRKLYSKLQETELRLNNALRELEELRVQDRPKCEQAPSVQGSLDPSKFGSLARSNSGMSAASTATSQSVVPPVSPIGGNQGLLSQIRSGASLHKVPAVASTPTYKAPVASSARPSPSIGGQNANASNELANALARRRNMQSS